MNIVKIGENMFRKFQVISIIIFIISAVTCIIHLIVVGNMVNQLTALILCFTTASFIMMNSIDNEEKRHAYLRCGGAWSLSIICLLIYIIA